MDKGKFIVVATSGSKRAMAADKFTIDDKSRVIYVSQGSEIVGIFPCENVQAAYWEHYETKPRS